MKQLEIRTKSGIRVICLLTLKEKVRLLFKSGFELKIDYENDSDNGEMVSYQNLKTVEKDGYV